MENSKEIWKDVPNYEGIYQVSNMGRVKSLFRILIREDNSNCYLREKILKGSIDGHGYRFYTLYNYTTIKTIKIHKLVAIAFLNHVPCGHKLVVDHINNDKLDNRLENLQLITQRENASKDRKGGSSRYVGVSLLKNTKKWRSVIYIDGKLKHLGSFDKEKDAHFAYQKKLKEVNKEIKMKLKAEKTDVHISGMPKKHWERLAEKVGKHKRSAKIVELINDFLER